MSDASPAPLSRYTQMLAKGGPLLPETRMLLQSWQPGETSAAFGRRVLRDDLLGRTTAFRVQNIVRVFSLRFLRPDDTAARHLKRLLAATAPRQVFNDLVFYYTARQDDLLRDYTVHRYWPAVRAGTPTISREDALALIADAHLDGQIAAPWSIVVRRKIAGTVLTALTAFGLLEKDRPGQRRVLPYAPADGTVLYLAYLLHGQGVTDAALAGHPDWALFGLAPREVWHRLEALVAARWLIVQRSGEVVRISWSYGSVEEVLDVLVGG